jgi:peptide/nickel transport system substrate-binding protein
MRNKFLLRSSIAFACLAFPVAGVLFLSGLLAPPPPTPSAKGVASAEGEAPFVPPPIESLKDVKWVPYKVAAAVEVLRERLSRQPAPTPDEEAFALRNAGAAENAKIASAVSRLPRSGDEVDWDATLVRWLFAQPKTMNPVLASTSSEFFLTNILFVTPFSFDADLKPLALAEVCVEWSTSEDGLLDKVVLRDDITWSDGAPFTARDIEFSFKVIMTPSVAAPDRTQCSGIKAVKAYDDRTVVYFHREPLATNVWAINFQIIPRHLFAPVFAADPTLEKSEAAIHLSRNPVTSGPFRFVSWKADEEIVCERRPEWFERDGKTIRAKPFLKTIRFRTIQNRDKALLEFKAGNLDEMELSAEQWQAQTGGPDFLARGTKVYGEEWHYSFIAWNQHPVPDAPFFKDPRAREAMSLAFAHEEFLDKICQGLYRPAPGIFHPASGFADPSLEPTKQDLRRAARLLAEAGWADSDGDGVLDKEIDGTRIPFRFTFLIGAGSFLARSVASLLRRDLEKIGVVCEAREVEGTQFFAMCKEHRFHSAAMLWGPGVDPDTLRNIWTTDAFKDEAGRNYIGYMNPEVDRLFEVGRRELDPAKRKEIYREIGRRIAGDFPYTFLYFRNAFFAVSKDLRGLNFSPRGPFNHFPGMHGFWKRKAASQEAPR